MATREELLAGLGIARSDFVVEVGGGHQPFHRANLILDKYPFDNLHRVEGLAHAAPVLIADAVRMPIPDKGCEVLFASHVIEHLDEPDRFLAEIRRCSRRAYIEFPSANREIMFAWGFHEWLVIPRGSHLTFYRNDIPQLFGDFFHANYDFLFDAWASRRDEDLNARVWCNSDDLTWSFADIGALEYLVEGSPTGRARVTEAPIRDVRYSWRQLAILALQRALSRTVLDRLVSFRRRRRRGSPVPVRPDIASRLMCIECAHAGLALTEDGIACPDCGRTYDTRSGLYDFDIGAQTSTDRDV